MYDREAMTQTARTRAYEVRANLAPPAWASKGGEPESWRRAALILVRDLLILTKGEVVNRRPAPENAEARMDSEVKPAATTPPRKDGTMNKITVEEAALVRKVLATTGYTAPMHERQEARRIVDRFLPPMPYTGRGHGFPMAFGDVANC